MENTQNNKDRDLIIFTQGARMLMEADTIQKTKEFKNLALTAMDWARRKGLGEETMNYARGYALEAERKMGEMLAITPRQKPGEYQRLLNVTVAPTLVELGISKRESVDAQRLAELPKEIFEEIKSGTKIRSKVEKEIKQSKKIEKVKERALLPDSKFRIVYADPPWTYNSGETHTKKSQETVLETHYPSMTLQEICLLDIKSICEKDAVLFLWVTSPLLEESLEVIKAWGFEYKTSMVWDKIKHNVGNYVSVRHEFLLICTKGSCLPDNKKLFDSVLSIERKKHSQKPEEFRKIIDEIYPYGKRIELFAREKKEGWEVFGNEC